MTPKRQKLVDAGLCIHYERCGNRRGPDGTGTECRPCADARSQTQAQRNARARAARRQQKLCTQCGEHRRRRGTLCWQCADKQSTYDKDYRARRRLQSGLR